jgi:hypothetical protein
MKAAWVKPIGEKTKGFALGKEGVTKLIRDMGSIMTRTEHNVNPSWHVPLGF